MSTPVAFLHIPKTGGTYISKQDVINPLIYYNHAYFSKRRPDIDIFPGAKRHWRKFKVNKETYSQHYVFTVVRNPFDWLVSYYHTSLVDKNRRDYACAVKGFDDFIKIITNRAYSWPSRKFLFWQIFDFDTGQLVPNKILRIEYLDEHLKELAKATKSVYKKKQKLNASKDKKDYKEYFSDGLVRQVNKTYKRELELFEYNFEGGTLTYNVKLNPKTTYNHKEDILSANN